MNLNLKGKTALVAGSTSGIGKAAAQELASMGARIILVARNEAKLLQTLEDLNSSHGVAHKHVTADFALRDQVEEAAKRALDLVDGTVHILINNTGGPPAGKALDASPQEFDHAFNMHLIGNHLLTQAVVRGMKAAGYGRIINVISTSVKQPLPNLGVSNTIRGAVANWSKTLAGELAPHGITVNNVLPGPTATPRLEGLAERKAKTSGQSAEDIMRDMGKATPVGRVAQPSEVANAIAFLASPAASYINGINVPVDGGRTLCL